MSRKSRRFQQAGPVSQITLDGDLLILRDLPELGSGACHAAGQRARVGRSAGWRGQRSPWHWRDRSSGPLHLLPDE